MSTVTAHTLFSRAVRYSSAADAASLGCPKPAVASLPFAPNSGKKKTPRSLICYYADRDSINHPSNIPPVALVNPSTPTATRWWKIKEHGNSVELTFFGVQDKLDDTLQVRVEGNVLVVTKKLPEKPPAEGKQPHDVDDISFLVRLLVPDSYDKAGITAVLDHRNLVVTIPKLASYTKVDVKENE